LSTAASHSVTMVATGYVALILSFLGVVASEMTVNTSNAMEGRRLQDHHCAYSDDCSKKGGRCCNSDLTCYRKNAGWAGCRWNCVPNTHYEHDHGDHRTPWACEKVGGQQHQQCAHHDDCSKKGGRCCNSALKCYRKHAHWASCRANCIPNTHYEHDVGKHRTPWSCEEVPVAGGGGGPTPSPTPSGDSREPQGPWLHGMKGTHFWDCEAGDCDSSLLRPFIKRKAVMPPTNAPTDPAEHGGSQYGEKLWMTGAMSDSLSRFMGPNLLGYDDQYAGNCGGCGQCVLVSNPDSAHPDWTVVVMKKVRCHPANPKCSGDQKTIDFAVPSFDHLQYSLANRCGKGDSDYTFLTREQSGTCGGVHKPSHCDCTKIPDTTPELKMMRRGCELFKQWDWHHGQPMNLKYKKVECPRGMVDRFSGPGGFGGQGVIGFVEAMSQSPALVPLGGVVWRIPLPIVGLGGLASLSAVLFLALRRNRGRMEPQLLDGECSS